MRNLGVLALAFVLATSALTVAAGPNPAPGAAVQVTGVIENLTTDTITVAGTTFDVTPDTVITKCGVPIGLADLEEGMTVKVCAKEVDGVLIACRITVKYACCP